MPSNPVKSCVALSETENHHARFRESELGCRSLIWDWKIQQKTASEKNQEPPEIFLGEPEGSFWPGRKAGLQPLPRSGDSCKFPDEGFLQGQYRAVGHLLSPVTRPNHRV